MLRISKLALSGILIIALTGCGDNSKPAGPASSGDSEQLNQAKASGNPVTLSLNIGKNVELPLVFIPSGRFTMGASSPGAPPDSEPPHEAAVDAAFYISRHEITQMEYASVMDSNPSIYMGRNLPVDSVSYASAAEFCSKLSERTKRDVRLPSELQWEYACRAGSTAAYYNGTGENSSQEIAWLVSNSNGQTHDVEGKPANPWGIFDMSGNVWELCAPSAGTPADKIVARGGSWMDKPEFCRSDARVFAPRDFKNANIGFRIIVAIK